jgi:cytochrome c-type biogenesis protein CcmH/NrfG
MRILRNGCVALTLLCFAGCTTLQPIEDFSPSKIRETVEVGDQVSIVAMNGRTYDLEVTAVEADALRGVAASGKAYKIKYEAIRSIRAEQIHAGHTAGAVGTTVGAVVTVAAVVTFIAVLIFFDELSGDD